MNTTTRRDARTRQAFKAGAERAGTTLTPIRVLVATHDQEGSATAKQLASDLDVDESLVRRGLTDLYDRGLATGSAEDGTPRRRGVPTQVTLTTAGRELAEWIIDQAGGGS